MVIAAGKYSILLETNTWNAPVIEDAPLKIQRAADHTKEKEYDTLDAALTGLNKIAGKDGITFDTDGVTCAPFYTADGDKHGRYRIIGGETDHPFGHLNGTDASALRKMAQKYIKPPSPK